MLFHSYIQSLSHHDALNLTTVLINTFVVIVLGVVGVAGYEFYESRKYKDIPDPPKPQEQDVATEHILFEYGTDRLAIEIHHYANPSTAEFLRHLKELDWDSSYAQFTKQAYYLMECMERLNHPNVDDIRYAFDIIMNSDELSEEAIRYIYKWLHIAKTYWMMHPEGEMIPIEMTESIEMDNVRMKSKSF